MSSDNACIWHNFIDLFSPYKNYPIVWHLLEHINLNMNVYTLYTNEVMIAVNEVFPALLLCSSNKI